MYQIHSFIVWICAHYVRMFLIIGMIKTMAFQRCDYITDICMVGAYTYVIDIMWSTCRDIIDAVTELFINLL